MKTLVLSHKHYLAPLAWRLSREGAETTLLVTKKRYQRAWEGRLPKPLSGRDIPLDDLDLKPWVEAALTGDTQVLTDLTQVPHSDFGAAPNLFFTLKTEAPTRDNYSLVLGGWFNGSWHLPHWYVPDWGLFPGGTGPEVVAGGAVLRGRAYPTDILEQLTEPLSQVGFRGLVGAGVRYNETSGKLEPTGHFHAGWDDWLHWELALCELPSWTSLLEGSSQTEGPTNDLPPYTVGVVVSQPPWPSVGHPVPAQVELALAPQITKNTFFHDICVEEGRVLTAGTDGLVGVARGVGRSLDRARGQALATVGGLVFRERQVRLDVGAQVPGVVVGLEELGWW